MRISVFPAALAAAIVLVGAVSAQAQVAATGLYGGGSLIGTFFDPGDGDLFATGEPSLTGIEADDEEDLGWAVFAGYRIFDYMAIEGGWLDLGGFEGRALTGAGGAAPGVERKSDTEVDGWNLRVLGIWPILCEYLTVHASTGAYFYDSQLVASDKDGQTMKSGDSGVAWTVGAGIESHPIPEVGVRLAYERFFNIENGLGEFDVDTVMLSVIFGPIWGLR